MKNRLIYQVAKDVEKRGFRVSLREIPKLNGSKLGLSLQVEDGSPVRTYYEEHFCHMETEGFTLTDMTNDFLRGSTEKMPELKETNLLENRQFLIEHAKLCVCKIDWNEAFLSDTPHKSIEGTDLAEYARIYIGDDMHVVPRTKQLQAANVSESELLKAARENSKKTYKVESLDVIIARMMGGTEMLPGNSGAYVITNDSAIHGAAAITDEETLATAYNLVGTREVYILPSSIHECLILPKGVGSEESINEMIQEINSTEVSREEQLSDHAYLYDGRSLKETKTIDRELAAGRSR